MNYLFSFYIYFNIYIAITLIENAAVVFPCALTPSTLFYYNSHLVHFSIISFLICFELPEEQTNVPIKYIARPILNINRNSTQNTNSSNGVLSFQPTSTQKIVLLLYLFC